MLNVICVKWGNRYSAKYVNRLRYMVKKNLTVPFTFICLTDDSRGIEPDIEIIKIPDEPKLLYHWNKMFLFNRDVVPDGKYLFFDLDVVIQKNIDDFANYPISKPCFAPKNWCDIRTNGWANLNSSIIAWDIGMADYYWDYFTEDIDLMTTLFSGLDSTITCELRNYELFPNWSYSFLYGHENHKVKHYDDGTVDAFLKYEPEYKVCLFNGCHSQINYDLFKLDYFKKYLGDYV